MDLQEFLLPKSTLEYLTDRIPIRRIPTIEEIDDGDDDLIVKTAFLLNIQPSIDEIEYENLEETTYEVIEAIKQLKPFTFSGEIAMDNNDIDFFIRLMSKPQLFVNKLDVSGNHIVVEGYNKDIDETYLKEDIKQILKPKIQDNYSTYTHSLTDVTDIQSLITNFCDFVKLPMDKVKITKHDNRIEFSVHKNIDVKEAEEYILKYFNYHRSYEFKISKNQTYDWVNILLMNDIKQLHPDAVSNFNTLLLELIDDHKVVIKYLLNDYRQNMYELYDMIIMNKMLKLTDSNNALKYVYLPRTDENNLIFTELESIPYTDLFGMDLVCPIDQGLQVRYAQSIRYKPEEIIDKLLERYENFMRNREIWRSVKKNIDTDYKLPIIHFLFKRLHKLQTHIHVSLYNNTLELKGHLLKMTDVLALFLFIRYAQSDGFKITNSSIATLKLLESIENNLYPSELLNMLLSDTNKITEVFLNKMLPNTPSEIRISAYDNYKVFAIPFEHIISLKDLRNYLKERDVLSDVTEVSYVDNGNFKHYYSVVSKITTPISKIVDDLNSKQTMIRMEYNNITEAIINNRQSEYDPDEITTILADAKEEYGPDYKSPYNQRIDIQSQDYKLDIVKEGKYYRLDAISILNDKPYDYITICYIPVVLTIEHPLLLDKLHSYWRQGRLLTKSGAQIYRVTRKLWKENTFIPFITRLTPSFWDKLSESQIKSVVENLL